ncbi:SH3 domain-containing protein [Oxynema aestuarii]|uniref:SH3 domain-containing protein n=1 Tax=Oxynema aestuarii AP17 TaxID=2064643 RepID=A0A6H1TY48_9CYAN|nr:SH3 domain-containing protein [Oxynema aestuarii]QIZ71538.1 SH3 domain-containing protein [Oxynema aestuarii AP17]
MLIFLAIAAIAVVFNFDNQAMLKPILSATILGFATFLPLVSVAQAAPEYNCNTREVWTPEKRIWCQALEQYRTSNFYQNNPDDTQIRDRFIAGYKSGLHDAVTIGNPTIAQPPTGASEADLAYSDGYLAGFQAHASDRANPRAIEGSCRQVNTDNDPLNLRKRPTTDSEIIGTLPRDAVVYILDPPDNNWVPISTTGVELDGYVYAPYLRYCDSEAGGEQPVLSDRVYGECGDRSCEELLSELKQIWPEQTRQYLEECPSDRAFSLQVFQNTNESRKVLWSCWEKDLEENGDRYGEPLGLLPFPGEEREFLAAWPEVEPYSQVWQEREPEEVATIRFKCATEGGSLNLLVTEAGDRVKAECYFQAGVILVDANQDFVSDGELNRGASVGPVLGTFELD